MKFKTTGTVLVAALAVALTTMSADAQQQRRGGKGKGMSGGNVSAMHAGGAGFRSGNSGGMRGSSVGMRQDGGGFRGNANRGFNAQAATPPARMSDNRAGGVQYSQNNWDGRNWDGQNWNRSQWRGRSRHFVPGVTDSNFYFGYNAYPYWDSYAYYNDNYAYYNDYYDDDSYAYSYNTYAAGDDSDAVQYCIQRFKSYDVTSRTYLGFDGQRHSCP